VAEGKLDSDVSRRGARGMDSRCACAVLSLLLLGLRVWAQLPPTQRLSVEDQREFEKELERLKALLPSANDKPAIELQIANTYAAGGKHSEAMERLRSLVSANLGFDPARDPDFAKLRDTSEFQSIMYEVRRQTTPVHNSQLIATLDGRDIRPENIAFDIKRSAFLLGNTARFGLVRCSLAGHCIPFVTTKLENKPIHLGSS